VSGADISLSPYVMFASSLHISLCFGLFSKLAYRSSLSSTRASDKSGILALGITVNAANDSVAIPLTFLGLREPRTVEASALPPLSIFIVVFDILAFPRLKELFKIGMLYVVVMPN